MNRIQHIEFYFVSLYKEANLLPIIECVCLILLVNLMCFADHLNSLLLIYLILMSKRIHLIQKYVVFKGFCCFGSKRFNFFVFVFYFNILSEISSTLFQLLNLEEFSNLSCLFQPLPPPPPVTFIEFWRIFQCKFLYDKEHWSLMF